MNVLFPLSAVSLFLPLLTRIVVLITFLLVGAWLLAKLAGSNNASFRSGWKHAR